MEFNDKKSIFFVVNIDRAFLSHRLPLALAALNNSYKVVLIAHDTGKRIELENYGIDFIDFPFDRVGKNIFFELKCVYLLYKIYTKKAPCIIHHSGIKVSLLGSGAAKLARIKSVVNAINGFGYSFTDGRSGPLQGTIQFLMLIMFKSRFFHYILQNPDDLNLFRSYRYTGDDHIHLIKGSGVDLKTFYYIKEPENKKLKILFSGRMLFDKGVVEFVNAAKALRHAVKGRVIFLLAGESDRENPASIPEEKIKTLEEDGYISWIGFQSDMASLLQQVNLVVLPSYREGLPKSLIEACAVGRAIITTDVIGCRECVHDGYNGYLVPAKDVNILAEKILFLINHLDTRLEMGKNGRRIAENEFSVDIVIQKHFEVYNKLL